LGRNPVGALGWSDRSAVQASGGQTVAAEFVWRDWWAAIPKGHAELAQQCSRRVMSV